MFNALSVNAPITELPLHSIFACSESTLNLNKPDFIKDLIEHLNNISNSPSLNYLNTLLLGLEENIDVNIILDSIYRNILTNIDEEIIMSFCGKSTRSYYFKDNTCYWLSQYGLLDLEFVFSNGLSIPRDTDLNIVLHDQAIADKYAFDFYKKNRSSKQDNFVWLSANPSGEKPEVESVFNNTGVGFDKLFLIVKESENQDKVYEMSLPMQYTKESGYAAYYELFEQLNDIEGNIPNKYLNIEYFKNISFDQLYKDVSALNYSDEQIKCIYSWCQEKHNKLHNKKLSEESKNNLQQFAEKEFSETINNSLIPNLVKIANSYLNLNTLEDSEEIYINNLLHKCLDQIDSFIDAHQTLMVQYAFEKFNVVIDRKIIQNSEEINLTYAEMKNLIAEEPLNGENKLIFFNRSSGKKKYGCASKEGKNKKDISFLSKAATISNSKISILLSKLSTTQKKEIVKKFKAEKCCIICILLEHAPPKKLDESKGECSFCTPCESIYNSSDKIKQIMSELYSLS